MKSLALAAAVLLIFEAICDGYALQDETNEPAGAVLIFLHMIVCVVVGASLAVAVLS